MKGYDCKQTESFRTIYGATAYIRVGADCSASLFRSDHLENHAWSTSPPLLHYFHVTPTINIPSIMTEGLKPQIGPLSQRAGEFEPAIYLFSTEDDTEDALTNWMIDALEEQYGNDVRITVLKLGIPLIYEHSMSSEHSYERKCYQQLPPDCILSYAEI